MNELSPISHQWTEEDRLRLIYRIAHAQFWFMRKQNYQFDDEGVKYLLRCASLMMILSCDSSEFIEAHRSEFNEFLKEEEK